MRKAFRTAALRLACLLCAAALGDAASGGAALGAEEGGARAEFWVELASDPWEPLPPGRAEAEAAAAAEMLEEAAFVFSGMFEGFEFEWGPRDPTRGREESFALRRLGALRPGDARLVAGPASAREGRLRAYVEFRPEGADLRLREAQSGPLWRSAQGLGYAPLDRSAGGRLAAYEDAVRAGVEALMRASLPNRPRLVRGRAAFAAAPAVAIVGGRYAVKARLRIEVLEVLGYGP